MSQLISVSSYFLEVRIYTPRLEGNYQEAPFLSTRGIYSLCSNLVIHWSSVDNVAYKGDKERAGAFTHRPAPHPSGSWIREYTQFSPYSSHCMVSHWVPIAMSYRRYSPIKRQDHLLLVKRRNCPSSIPRHVMHNMFRCLRLDGRGNKWRSDEGKRGSWRGREFLIYHMAC